MVEFKVGDLVECNGGYSFDPCKGKIVRHFSNNLQGVEIGNRIWSYWNRQLKLIKGANMKYELGQKLKNNFGDTREIIEVNNGFYHTKYNGEVSDDHCSEVYLDKQGYKPITSKPDLVTIKMSRSSAEQKGITGFIEED